MNSDHIPSPQRPPGWLNDLEDRIQRAKQLKSLGHEAGAGAKCNVCEAKCPGLELHYWRKRCNLCKCPKEDHDVPLDDEGLRFQILFNASKIQSKNAVGSKIIPNLKEKVSGKHQMVQYDWLPPGADLEMANEYIAQLPKGKIPISGTDGAKFRRYQLEKQIPLHDITPELCDNLTPEEQLKFREYIGNICDNVVGQAKVQRICQNTMMSQSVPLNTLGPQSSGSLIRQPKTSYRMQKPPNFLVHDFNNLNIDPLNNNEHVPSIPPPAMTFRLPSQFIPKMPLAPHNTPNAINDDHFCNNKNKQNNEDELFGRSGNHKLDPSSTTLNTVQPSDGEKPYSFAIQQGFDSHPHGYRPAQIKGSQSERPNSDLANYHQPAAPDVTSQHPGSQANSNTLVVDTPLSCAKCKQIIPFGSVAVLADRAEKHMAWHASCFVCYICEELLVDLMYFYHKGQVYCGRHYAEANGIPRCAACDELIFVNEFTLAEDKTYHVKHFCCAECDTELAGNEYLLGGKENLPTCLNCYEKLYSEKCKNCTLAIKAHDKFIHYGDGYWHIDCFKCETCHKIMSNMNVCFFKKRPFCSRTCAEQSIST